MSFLVVTGTDTEVGKTIVTAAVAAVATHHGSTVAVVKPVQTGVAPGAESDIDTVRRLAGVTDVTELARYPEPLAPETAARRAGMAPLSVDQLAAGIRRYADRDLVVVEGAGGLLVRLGDGHTVADVAAALDAPVLVVARAGLGTLNSTALTCEAIRNRDLSCAGVVIGSWPADADLAARCNLDDMAAYARAPLLGVLPAGLGSLAPTAFLEAALAGLAPALGGGWSPTAGPHLTDSRR